VVLAEFEELAGLEEEEFLEMGKRRDKTAVKRGGRYKKERKRDKRETKRDTREKGRNVKIAERKQRKKGTSQSSPVLFDRDFSS
jgi:hypothetical protein